jgi:hypothetical protein
MSKNTNPEHLDSVRAVLERIASAGPVVAPAGQDPAPVVAYPYDPATGKFTGRSVRGPREVVERMVEPGQALHFGPVDPRRQVVTKSGTLRKVRPERPADTDDLEHVWDDAADDWVRTPTRAKLARDARAKRDDLLRASDWVTLRAADTGQPIPAAWSTYRTALRSITEQPGFPASVEWPATPPAA